MNVHILGVRGSVPYFQGDKSIYGGNTQCVMLEIDDSAIIFDGGTGILSAHQILDKNPNIKYVYIFLTHYHLDHVIGLTMSPLVLNARYDVTLYAPSFDGKSPQKVLEELFRPPYWPITFTNIPNNLTVSTLDGDTSYQIKQGVISTISLNHPNGSIGLKFACLNHSIAYIFDHEHMDSFDISLGDFIKEIDLLIIDCPYSIEDYKNKIGYGHSPLPTITSLADKNSVQKMLISHHDISKTDLDLENIDMTIKNYNPNYCLAKEGMVLNYDCY